jgi:glutamate N-acetyltransferase / amino-acid N-acetyltransferase
MNRSEGVLSAEHFAINGFKFSAVAAGVKHAGTDRLDLALIAADSPCELAGVTTTNLVAAAPVHITRERVASGRCQAVLANSGNANACTAEQGMSDALALTSAVAEGLGIDACLVVPMSTGVIGNPLPVARMSSQIPTLIRGLDTDRAEDVARAIMTTDTVPKTVLRRGETTSGPFSVLGIAKGAGMIAPNMATMLAVLVTDIRVSRPFLQECLQRAVEASFNRITIDADMSTNDTAVILSGGSVNAATLPDVAADRNAFADAVGGVCLDLAHRLVLDGEGVTKVVEIRVKGAPDRASAAAVARTIGDSLLVKTAFHGQDPNWGRIIAAAGRAGVSFVPDVVDLFIGTVPILRDGRLSPDDWESAAHGIMAAKEFSVLLDLKAGEAHASILTTDLSKEYVGINADYRS